jgi:hypothetical protein
MLHRLIVCLHEVLILRKLACTLPTYGAVDTMCTRVCALWCRIEPIRLMGNTVKEYCVQFVADRKYKGTFAGTRGGGRTDMLH